MAKIQPPYATVTGITNANYTTAANAVKIDVAAQACVQAVVTSAGSPSACTLEYTLDRHELIDAATATWVSDFTSTRSTNFGVNASGPVTGVRLNVSASGGTWTLNVLQVYDAGKVN
jgi:hypothetical protein